MRTCAHTYAHKFSKDVDCKGHSETTMTQIFISGGTMTFCWIKQPTDTEEREGADELLREKHETLM